MQTDVMNGSVPAVDVADLKLMWDYSEEVMAMHPGATVAPVGLAVWQNLFRPGTDIRAVMSRYNILLDLKSVWDGGKPNEKAFKVAANIELDWPKVGIVIQEGSPFSLERFIMAVRHGIGC